MKQRPQTIQIFLPDGSPISIKEAEIRNRLVKAILFPRNKIQEVAKREMVHFTGVYFLFGSDENSAKPLVYIGEGEDCFKRVLNHNRRKDFWTHCVIVATSTNEYTKTDGKFLEYLCLEKVQSAGRYKTENDTGSKKPSLPENREHDLLDNFETIKVLLTTLGYPIFDESVSKTDVEDELLFINRVGVKASALYTDEGIVILEGSQARVKESSSVSNRTRKLRKELLEEGVIIQEGDKYYFTQSFVAGAPSNASDLIIGNSTNGWVNWKNRDGVTLDKLKRR